MDRDNQAPQDDSGFDSLGDATGMEAENERPAMEPSREVTGDAAAGEPSGDEKTAIEGAAGLGATNTAWGATPTGIEGGAGTDVPAEGEDELRPDVPPDQRDSTDPRGY